MAFESLKDTKNDDGTFPAMWNPTVDATGRKRMEATKDDYLDGRYIDTKENVGKNKSIVYTIEKEDGVRLQVWGSTALDGEMAKVAPGSFVRIQWHGRKLKKASKDKHKEDLDKTDYYHDWEVFVDKDKSRSITTPSHKAAEPVNESAASSGPEDDGDSLPF